MSERRIQIGDRIKDKITGLEGIATGMTEYINGCRQWLVHPEGLDKDGKARESVWVDEGRFEVTKKQVFAEPIAFAQDRAQVGALTGGEDRIEPTQTERRT